MNPSVIDVQYRPRLRFYLVFIAVFRVKLKSRHVLSEENRKKKLFLLCTRGFESSSTSVLRGSRKAQQAEHNKQAQRRMCRLPKPISRGLPEVGGSLTEPSMLQWSRTCQQCTYLPQCVHCMHA